MNRTICGISAALFFLAQSTQAQNFTGTNAPGQGTNFTFTLGAGATNLSLVVSNTASAYSYLLLKKGGAPASDTDFDFIARLTGQTNEINLEAPEYAPMTYGFRVLTPVGSGTHAFNAFLTTNRTDLRSAGYPVLKPMAFSTAGTMTNTGSGAWKYFQVDVPTNLSTGWRVVLSTNGTGSAVNLYVRRGALPTTGSYDKASVNQTIDTVTFMSAEATAGTYFIGVYLPSGAASSANFTLSAELSSLKTLTWDPGTTHLGTQVFTNLSATGGDYYFTITTLGTAVNVWRTALNVQSGEADVYLLYGSIPSTSSYNFASTRVGSDGFVLSQGSQFQPGQNWYLLVHAMPGAQWNLVTGEAYVAQLPPLAANATSGTNATIGAEGMRYFKTTITTNTLAWRLGLNGLNNQLYVKKTAAPHPYNTSTYDLTQAGQMLVVPTYLNVGDQYFIGISGNPGLNFTLDSRQQPITDLAFNSATNFSVTTYGYTTFRVQVPIQQIAWQITATPTAGDVNVSVRRDNVPNEFVNDAFSEVAGSTPDSVTLVPPTLSDGTFYITTYGNAPYTCSLTNGNPVITDVHYVFQVTNDAPARVGWRYYRIVNTAEQLGSLGWELDLANQVPGSEIAIRRNAVPGRWNYRNSPYNPTGYSTLGYRDIATTVGFLQQPNHQADIWYIGIYTPAAPLGNFVLTGIDLTGPQVSFDGVGASTNIVNQPVSKLQFFRIDVPTNILGWDLRITNVTSGDPRLVVCHDRLPYDLGTHDLNGYGWSPSSSLTWPSGSQIAATYDWTGEYQDPNATNQYGHVFEVGMGNPLQSGTYYIGVVNSTGPGYQNPMSYSLVSRGIGTNVSIPITDLAFTNGTVSNPGLRARETAYYRIVVPTNVPSWELKLTADAGESMLILEKDYVPSVWASSSSPVYSYGGRQLQKLGNERYVLLPSNGQSNVLAGTYYFAVVSEGVNPNSPYPRIGTGSSAYTLTSLGLLTITNLGTLDATGVTDILHTNSCEGGQIKAFRFTVPPGTLAMEVHLDDRVGNPLMTFRADNQFPNPTDSYGCDGGQNYTWYNSGLVNIANPTPTNYTLIVQAASYSSGYSNASYTIRVHALTSQPIGFDGAALTTVGQPSGLWKYYTITIPTNALGWDLRITNVLSGDPRLVIRRDLAPDSLGNHDINGYGWTPQTSSSWPSGYQIAAGYDWTGEYLDPNGTNRYGHIFEVGMGNPLSPGNYIIGVLNSSGPGYQNPMSYTLISRGIGTNLSIPINDLTFTNGVVSKPSLIPREAAYYRVVVPTNMPSWKLKLNADAGETLLMLQKDALPNVWAGGTSPIYLYGGREVKKQGNEQYVLLPNSGQSNIVSGTYYLAVAGEGMNPHSLYIGTNTSAFTLTSFGALTISNLGPVDFTGVTDIIVTNSNEGGEVKAYQFSVPAGTLSLEVRLESLAGYPLMTFRTGDQIPNPPDGYGSDGGQGYTWSGSGLINIANPIATNYTMIVQAAPYSGIYSNATYRLRFHALGPQPVGFDGGSSVITGQPSGTWRYFTITVPTNAMGWDLRITNVLSGDPRLVIRRDLSPDNLGNHDAGGYGWTPQYASTWPSGYQIAAGYDWTGEYRDPNGTNRYGHVFEVGMGNPLSPGNYIVGVLNSTGPGYQNPMSYTLVSRGIGAGFAIPINDLAFTNGSATNLSLLAREAAYYRVVVPTNVPNWKLRLTTVSGESLLALQKDALPGVFAAGNTPTILYGGRKMQKAGNEQYLLLPNSGSSNIIAGTYYLLVASEGVNPNTPNIGTNSSSYVLNSYGIVTKTNLGTVGVADFYGTNVLQGGEALLYNFTIPPATAAVEVRLDNRAGNPYMTVGTGPYVISPYDNYGNDGGVGAAWSSATLLTFPNPTATNYSLTVQAANQSGYPDANCIVHVRRMPTPTLNFSANLNTNGFTNVVSATLSDNQRAFYQVIVPATNNGHAVIGWKLDLEQTSGTPSVRVRQNLLPDDVYYGGTSPWATGEAIIAPPYLTPGTWYVEVKGSGATSFTLTSSDLTTERPAWSMPVEGNLVTTPGLPSGGPLFGDTGVDTNGVPLPGDQGIDLAQGNFHFYSVTVPPGNIGVMRTRLDAISGDPNLYIRVGSPPTLMHNASGVNGTLYDRSLTANIGSEYGNWVPLAGRYEAYLTPGTWYFAVKASGNSNVRYRLRMFTGIVNDLSLNNGSYTGQNLAAGDWMFYRVRIPTNAPVNWNVTFGQQLGDVVMYVRDRVPPGQATTPTDLRDWSDDNKNHGPYPIFDPPGTYTVPCPPMRPGNAYFLGFRAVNDATFSVSCNTNGGSINYTNTIPFYAGTLPTTSIPGYGILKLRIDVPADAQRLIVNFTNPAAIYLYLDQGSVPTRTTSDHWYSQGSVNPVLNQALYNATGWPWQPNYMYFLTVTNTSAVAQNFSLGVDGRNCATDDYDGDGLPDCWELSYFPSIYSYGPANDPDGDGVNNLDEYLEGTVPNDPLSFHPRLQTSAQYGAVTPNPAGTVTTTAPPKIWYNLNQTVQLTAVPNAGYAFLSWSGDASGTANPLSLQMNGHKNVTAVFGLTNQPNADYRFQNNLHSSVGTPPDLTDIAAGNTFLSDVVDGNPQTVYRFPQGSGVVLQPATGVIPTNNYTMILLFRFDTISGWRRIIDFKNPVADTGLYQVNGQLNFFGAGAAGPAGSIAVSNYVQVAITRDGSNSNVVGFVNGAQQFSFVDSGNLATLSGSPLWLRFFKDNTAEDAPGAVARIRLYDKPMSSAQIAVLDRSASGIVRPVFDRPFAFGGTLNLPAHNIIPGLTYRLQYSSNLVNWLNLSTNTPLANPFTFSDPLGPVSPDRFYRLITP